MSYDKKSPVTITLVITIVMMYLFYSINPETFVDLFVLKSGSVFKDFAPWQLVTYAFFFPENLIFFFFHVMIFLIMGISLEHVWGSVKFGIYVLALILFRSLPAFLLGVSAIEPIIGHMYLSIGLMVAFGFNFPEREFRLFFVIPFKMKYLAIFGLCGVPLLILYPFFQYGRAFGIFTPGMISLPVPIASALVNALSFLIILIYWRFIFSQKPVDGVVSKIKQNLQSIEQDNQRLLKIHANKKYADLLTDYENKLDIDSSVLAAFEGNQESLCAAEDFDREDPYCLECEKYPYCARRYLDKQEGKGGR